VSVKGYANTAVNGAGGSLSQPYTDNSGTPGNTTINTPSGRAAIAAAASACVVTNSSVLATSKVFISLKGTDATAITARVSAQSAGSFTVTAIAAATGTTVFDFMVVN
jgi:hypothetical protein